MQPPAAALLWAVATLLLPAASLAQAAQPVLTAADVRRIALASAPGAGAGSRLGAGSSGLQQAVTLAIPVDYGLLKKDPALASTSVTAPPPGVAANRFRAGVQAQPRQQAPAANSRVAAVPLAPIAANAPFVRAQGTRFTIASKTFFPVGTNWYDAILYGKYTPAFLTAELNAHWQQGTRVIRIFGFSTSGADEVMCCKGRLAIQQAPMVYNEAALKQYDYFMDACAKVGIRVIIALTNHEPNMGGTQWYVDATIKKGQPKALFYTANQPRAAYKHWLAKLANRKNTVNGRIYKNDPTIFSFELCNECHTVDNYENAKKMYPGQLLYNWLVEMSAYLKNDLKVKPLVSNGNEGYRVKGTYDPHASASWPFLNWANTGLKGEDFNRNLYIKTLDFATIHVYPQSFGLSNTSYQNVNEFYVGDRMRLARSANKPLLLEEFGAQRNYIWPPASGRDTVMSSVLSAANAYGLAGALVWQCHPTFGDDDYYDFNFMQAGGPTMIKQAAWLNSGRAAGAKSPWVYDCIKGCTDYQPGGGFTCAQQKSFGKCCEPWMRTGSATATRGYCTLTCDCGCNNSAFTTCPTSLAQRSAAATGAKYAPKPVTKKPTKRVAVATIKKAG